MGVGARMLPAVLAAPGVRQCQVSDKGVWTFAHADCLLLPSRFVPSAWSSRSMACGTTAVVSTRTGAKAMIEAFP